MPVKRKTTLASTVKKARKAVAKALALPPEKGERRAASERNVSFRKATTPAKPGLKSGLKSAIKKTAAKVSRGRTTSASASASASPRATRASVAKKTPSRSTRRTTSAKR